MKLRALLPILLTYLIAGVLLGPTPGPTPAQTPRPVSSISVSGTVSPVTSPITPVPNPFDPVWEIMNRDRQNKGCVNCHIAPDPRIGFWFGADKESVLFTLLTGINPNGDVLDTIPVEGGRFSLLGQWLHQGVMPLGGQQWDENDLLILDRWLILFE